MTTTIDMPGLDQSLGHSLIFDEHKGDFAQARQLAERQLAQARQHNDAAQLADALLARAVVHVLQGEPAAALRCYDEIGQVAGDDLPRQLRAAVYATLAAYQRFNMFPSGSAADGTEFELRRAEFLTILAAQSQRRSAAQADTPALQLEQHLVAELLPNLLQARSFIAGAVFASPELAAQLRDLALATPQTFRQQLADLDPPPGLRAYADLQAADLHRRAGETELAAALLAQAIDGYTGAGDMAGLALCHLYRGDWLCAPFSTPLALNLALQSSTSEGSQLATAIEAQEFSLAGLDLAGALRAYAEASRLFRRAQAPRGQAALWLRRGYLAWLADDAQAGLAAAEQAALQCIACGDQLGAALARTHALLLGVAAGRLPEDQASARAIGRWGAEAGCFSYVLGLGLLCSRMGRHWLLRRGDYERALACFRLAAALNQALGATTHQVQNIVDQAAVLDSVGERAGAPTLYEQAIDLYLAQMQRSPDLAERLRQRTILLTSYLYQLSNQVMDADGMERAAARLAQQIAPLGDPGGFSEAAAALLTGDAQRGGLDQRVNLVAASYAHELIRTARVLVPAYRARAARDRGAADEMRRQFELAEAALQSIDGEQRDFLQAALLGHQRRYAEAAAIFRRHMAAPPTDSALAEALAILGAQGQAELQLQLRRQHAEAAAAFVRLRSYAEARAHFAALEQIAGVEWWADQEQPWEALSDYGEMYEGLGLLADALAAYDRAIGLLEARQQRLSRDELKTALAAGQGPQYLYFYAARAAQKFQAQLLASGDPAQAAAIVARAFSYAERGKARALLDLLAGSVALAGAAPAESTALRAWRELTGRLSLWRGLLARERGQQSPDATRIALLSQQIADGEAELLEAERALARSDPNFYQLLDPQAQPLSLAAVSAALAERAPAQTALVSYFFLGEELLLWAITGQGLALAHLTSIDVRALERDIRAFHRACERRQPLEQLGAALSATLLEPLAEVLRANTRLLIVPYGVAHSLPFQALPWQGQPLAASHTISYLPNASALQFLGSGSSVAARILAVGDPARMSFAPPFVAARIAAPRLPAASAEAVYVASLFAEQTVLIGEQATEAAVRAQIDQYTLLHFATHGYLSEDAPLLSAILFADGDALNVYEIMSLGLRADLVVLSACRTALGTTTGGDDVLGLTRGLLAAGARAAVVSLWPVDDVSTSLLMGSFYRHLRAGATHAEALRAAQAELRALSADDIARELRRLRQSLDAADRTGTRTRDLIIPGADTLDPPPGYSHPFYWAPFVVVG